MRLKKKVRDSLIENSNIVLPSHANALGTVFGGTIMGWIDIAGAICAQKHSNSICVTASVDALNFLLPVKVGDTVTLKARLVFVGRTSMMVHVDVVAQRVGEEDCRKCVEAFLTFVAIDENGAAKLVPELILETDEERQRFQEAAERRKQILSQKKSH